MTTLINLRVTRLEYISDYNFPVVHAPYCVIKLGSNQESTFAYKNAGKNPEWNQLFQLTLSGLEPTLKFEVFNKSSGTDTESIGEGEIEISKLTQPGKHGHRIKLVSSYNHIGCLVIGSELIQNSEQKAELLDSIIKLSKDTINHRALIVGQEELVTSSMADNKNDRTKETKSKSSTKGKNKVSVGVMTKFARWCKSILQKGKMSKKDSLQIKNRRGSAKVTPFALADQMQPTETQPTEGDMILPEMNVKVF